MLECFYRQNKSKNEELKSFIIPYIIDEYREHDYVELKYSCDVS